MNALPRYVSDSMSLSGALWRRSSRSTGANNCVETAPLSSGPAAGLLAVRDSKDTAGPAVLFAPHAWEGFIGSLR
ncbi:MULTISPECIES: DUF397 domain-containing protein [unclassified Streptomyces]|uniref:DUF397 domain-containing protein n=1 Tax=unclassified Streptomyces TaxID=2593676 RepID=UPI000DBA10E6|nr:MULTISPECIES: DUF397 domain-containing protein [unclassified Streptomyces]MYT75622.1 DUF397 domain-containing protein [Streptomyces sp. SID8367]RAJ87029.1 uncharacterized protein DUF397 [Streptomyces sp. PsTaAH-137]